MLGIVYQPVWKGHGHRSVPGMRSGVQGQSQGPGTLSVSRPGSCSPDTPTPQNALLCPFSNSDSMESIPFPLLLQAGEGGRAFNVSSLQPTVAVCLNCSHQLMERFRDLTIYLVFAARRQMNIINHVSSPLPLIPLYLLCVTSLRSWMLR